jgi:hypothetical protein
MRKELNGLRAAGTIVVSHATSQLRLFLDEPSICAAFMRVARIFTLSLCLGDNLYEFFTRPRRDRSFFSLQIRRQYEY